MNIKELAEFIGKRCEVKVSAGSAVWFIPAKVVDVRIRFGLKDFSVTLDDNRNQSPAWVTESFVKFDS